MEIYNRAGSAVPSSLSPYRRNILCMTYTHVERAQVREVMRGLHVHIGRGRLVGAARGVGGAQLLHPIGVTQRVQRVFARRHSGRDHRDHTRARFVADETVAQHLRQLRYSER